MKESSSGGASFCEGFQGNLEGGLLDWETRKMRILTDMYNAL
jgi:hypothetical protein